ncbi:hypothetical protein B7494_g1839 [Chlorociboria aeruginascens]|nr:hypothetical protein B7494_g1839 [Chlorociboria aeruginascens]
MGSLMLRDATEAKNTSAIAQYATGLTGVDLPADHFFTSILWWSLGVMALLILSTRLLERFNTHLRHMIAMKTTGDQQSYWAHNHTSWWKFKKFILYAPLWNKRHNREFRLSSAVNMGTLPSRFHTVLLVLYFISNVIYCIVLDYSRTRYAILAELRGRSGVLAVANMLPLVIFAGRNNPLIPILQISFDTYNLVHRWMGRIVAIETIVHTIAWACVKYAAVGWSGIMKSLGGSPFISWGAIGTVVMILLVLTSLSPVRHAFYETFLDVHIILAIIATIGIWIHCELAHIAQFAWIKAFLALWVGDRLGRIVRLITHNYSRQGWTKATVEALPGDASRVTVHLPNYVDIKPGTHAYLRFAGLNPALESHPFSVAWIDHISTLPTSPTSPDDEPMSEKKLELQPKRMMRTNVAFIIAAQTGMTRRLFQKANATEAKAHTISAAFEGPYAGHHSLDSYGHAVLFAGSSGITHQISYCRQLINGYNDGTVATRRIILVWIVRDAEQLEWVRPWMDEILRMPNRRDILTIKLFVTRPKNPKEIHSPSSTVQMFPGRPDVNMIIQNEVSGQVGAMVVTVCGPGGLADNVRAAVREVQEVGNVDFIEESFTW